MAPEFEAFFRENRAAERKAAEYLADCLERELTLLHEVEPELIGDIGKVLRSSLPYDVKYSHCRATLDAIHAKTRAALIGSLQ